MPPPRPTMSSEDVRELREFFDIPEGRRVLTRLGESYHPKALPERRGDYWTPSPPGSTPFPLDCEAAGQEPVDPQRLFPSPPPEPPTGFWHRLLILVCGH